MLLALARRATVSRAQACERSSALDMRRGVLAVRMLRASAPGDQHGTKVFIAPSRMARFHKRWIADVAAAGRVARAHLTASRALMDCVLTGTEVLRWEALVEGLVLPDPDNRPDVGDMVVEVDTGGGAIDMAMQLTRAILLVQGDFVLQRAAARGAMNSLSGPHGMRLCWLPRVIRRGQRISVFGSFCCSSRRAPQLSPSFPPGLRTAVLQRTLAAGLRVRTRNEAPFGSPKAEDSPDLEGRPIFPTSLNPLFSKHFVSARTIRIPNPHRSGGRRTAQTNS
jgi:hypothetical protein